MSDRIERRRIWRRIGNVRIGKLVNSESTGSGSDKNVQPEKPSLPPEGYRKN